MPPFSSMAAFADSVKACACAKGEGNGACVCACVRACECACVWCAGTAARPGLIRRRANHLDGETLDGETARGGHNLLELELVLGRSFALDQRRVVNRAALGLGVEHRELPNEEGHLGGGAGTAADRMRGYLRG